MIRSLERQRGFTLIELLIVVGVLGLVMGSIYSVYITHQKTAYAQGEVEEVQQNVRVALDNLSRDITMAGAMILPATATPIAAGSGSPAFPTYSSNIMLNTASAYGRFARVEFPGNTYTANGSSITLPVESPATATSPNIVDGFAAGDNVRLIRPVDGSQYLSNTQSLVVTGTDRGVFGITPPSITLSKSDNSSFNNDIVNSSDIITKVADTSTYPMTISYFVADSSYGPVNGLSCPANQKCLIRQVNGSQALSDIVATNVSSLRFSYLDDSYNEASVPSDLTKVRAVRITLLGTTAKTVALAGVAKVRAVTTVVKLRNRR